MEDGVGWGRGGEGGANNLTEIYIAQWEQSQFGRFQILVRVENWKRLLLEGIVNGWHLTLKVSPSFKSNMLIIYSFIKNEIHLEICGYHGDSSFKMSCQVANIDNPNRKDNTVVFNIFETKDYRVNINLDLECFKILITSFKNPHGSK